MPPHTYENYRSPFASSIAELLQEPGRIRAQQALTTGNANAQAAQASGNAWGNAIATIGQSVAAIPQQLQQQKMLDARTAEMTALAQDRQLRARQGLDLQKQNAFIDQTMKGAMKTDDATGIRTFDRSTFEQSLVDGGMGHLYPELSATLDKLDASAAKRTAEGRSLYAHSLVGIEQAGYTPQSLLSAAAFLKANGAITDQQLQPLQDALAKDASPEAIQKLVAGMGQTLPEYQALKTAAEKTKTDQAKITADTAKTTAETAKLQAEVAGTLPMTPAQVAAQATAQQQAKGLADARAETARHNRVQEGTGAQGAAGGLTNDAVEYTATQYRVLGAQGIPTRLGEAEKTKIINAAAAQTKALGQSPAVAVQKQAAFKADAGALNLMRKMSSSAESFENKALAQADVVVDLSGKVGRTGSPLLNKALLEGKKELLGDTNTQLLFNALTTFTSEYAKIMEGSTGSVAASSESARKATERLVKAGLAPDTLAKTIDLMKREMRFTIQGYDATIDHISTRMGGAPAAATPEAAPVAAPKRVRYGMDGKPLAN